MVVLDGGGMLTSGANQYLQPDYLSPLPTTLDAKKSPLALLAQTCSQIGADTPSKPLSLDKPSKKATSLNNNRPSSSDRQDRQQQSPRTDKASDKRASPATSSSPATSPEQPTKLAFKPYEANVLSRRDDRPPSKTGSISEAEDRKSAPPRKSVSPPAGSAGSVDRVKSASPRSASPVIRSGLEVLQGHPKDVPLGTFKPPTSLAGLTSAQIAQLCCPPGYEGTHPAFRPPFAGSPFGHLLAYPGATQNPYLTYARVKTPSGSDTVVPVCKDPYCTGCQFSMHNALLLGAGGGACPAGCTQCEHQKYGLPGLAGYPHQMQHAAQAHGRPYVCNWIAGDSYCGKRFSSSDELLQHLRTHTTIGAVPTTSASAVASAYNSARYHPYAKPGPGSGNPPGASSAAAAAAAAAGFPGGLGSPFSAFNPASLGGLGAGLGGLSALGAAGLGPYYSPYALYGQRLGAAVHP